MLPDLLSFTGTLCFLLMIPEYSMLFLVSAFHSSTAKSQSLPLWKVFLLSDWTYNISSGQCLAQNILLLLYYYLQISLKIIMGVLASSDFCKSGLRSPGFGECTVTLEGSTQQHSLLWEIWVTAELHVWKIIEHRIGQLKVDTSSISAENE